MSDRLGWKAFRCSICQEPITCGTDFDVCPNSGQVTHLACLPQFTLYQPVAVIRVPMEVSNAR